MAKKSIKKDADNIKTVVHVSREYGELAGAGGIKDVTEGLARATAASGVDTHVFLPYYQVIKGKVDVSLSHEFNVAMNYPNEKRFEPVRVYTASMYPKLTLHLIEADRFRFLCENAAIERRGIYTYTEQEAEFLGKRELKGKGYFDYFAMNVLLVKATLNVLGERNLRPDIIHCHDGHAALLPMLAQASEDNFAAFLRYTPTLITVHNAGKGYHQEIDDVRFAAAICGMRDALVRSCLLDNKFDPLYAGALFATAINTVSENYARELQHAGQDWMTGWLGHALAGNGIELRGITNGVDPKSQLPANWKGIKEKESFKKEALQEIERGEIPKGIRFLGKTSYYENKPLLTFIGRLDQQKGYDILVKAIDLLFAEDEQVQLLGLGDGDPYILAQYELLARKYEGRVCIAKGYSPELAKKIYAAGDFFVVPSRYEPCGLTDFFAQLVGNVPIVHAVGGLVKVLDGRFGFSYLGGERELIETFKHALQIYRATDKKKLRKIQQDAIKNIDDNFTWDRVLEKKYLPLYKDMIAKAGPASPY